MTPFFHLQRAAIKKERFFLPPPHLPRCVRSVFWTYRVARNALSHVSGPVRVTLETPRIPSDLRRSLLNAYAAKSDAPMQNRLCTHLERACEEPNSLGWF